jgi:hypothetical protein
MKPLLQLMPHVPPVHVATPFVGGAHAFAHEPHALGESRRVSQPSLYIELQSPKPDTHDATAHVPALHAGIPFATAQPTPHALQFATVPRAVSQPSLTTPLQSAVAGGHASITHDPPLHDVAAPPAAAHDAHEAPHSVVELSAAQ